MPSRKVLSEAIEEMRTFVDIFSDGHTQLVSLGAVGKVRQEGAERAERLARILTTLDLEEPGARAAVVQAHDLLGKYHAALAKLIGKLPKPRHPPEK